MSEDIKFCVDCLHHSTTHSHWAVCLAETREEPHLDPVTGKMTGETNYYACSTQRKNYYGACGPAGIRFEPKLFKENTIATDNTEFFVFRWLRRVLQ